MSAVVIIVRTCVNVWWAPMHVCAPAVPYWCWACRHCRLGSSTCTATCRHAFVSDEVHWHDDKRNLNCGLRNVQHTSLPEDTPGRLGGGSEWRDTDLLLTNNAR